ncbi:putative nucleotidyltransferase with HDIG domain [Paenibacillus sp. PastF-3]|uniref:HD-GYP domain-containing protein n=1 Tax=unclassified Paenibacillus TaxID=185978 RepID=UPI000B9FB1FC|nr:MULTISPECIES: HD-GYP domain-containing protein [unclassified Paenibacillus]MDH6372795.1 putative nucleotidyltransferase with HDIG domain [Paenibacillus sp. PastF-3]OZQ97371.1 hypothetical protein CA598_06145 [Paenibacillus sp. VTT E-133291]
MRLLGLNRCEPGMILAQPIFNDRGNMLLSESTKLTNALIERLEILNINTIYINGDYVTDGIVIEDDIPYQKRVEAIRTIENTFSAIREGNHKSKTLTRGLMVKEIQQVFDMILAEFRQKKQLLNLLIQINVKDTCLFTHSLNVTLYAVAMGIKMGLTYKQLQNLGVGALLHDIGKLFIPQYILSKKGALEEAEFEIMKRHTEYGFEFLRKEPEVSSIIAHCAYQHHEKLDGTGYPRGLKGDEIHLFGRILAVADVFDALTSHRVYRNAMLPHDAIEIIWAGCHTQFDKRVIEAFHASVALYPIGVTVILNTNEAAVVVGNDHNYPQRPLVRVFKDAEGNKLNPYFERDLSKELSVMITECEAII